MTSRRERRLPTGAEAAVEELVQLIRGSHPDASFDVRRGPDDRREVILYVAAPGADPEDVLNLVMDRLLEFQVEQRLPLWVVPLDTPPVDAGAADKRGASASLGTGAAPSR